MTKIIAVTACPSGVAHTYMAAEALVSAAKAKGWQVKVETQGSIGLENELTAADVAEADMVILEEMPVKSLISFPQTGTEVPAGQAAEIRGHAWAGNGDVAAVHVSTDFGQTWQEAALDPAPNRFAWQRWRRRSRRRSDSTSSYCKG